MKLRYTSLQVDTGAAEERIGRRSVGWTAGRSWPATCTARSRRVAAAFAAARARAAGWSYVMTDSAALPLALSDLVADLRERGLLAATVTCGQAFGGDHEAVNVPSALQVAVAAGRRRRRRRGARARAWSAPARDYGFGGVEVAAVVDAAAHLGGRPIVAVRYSDADRGTGTGA